MGVRSLHFFLYGVICLDIKSSFFMPEKIITSMERRYPN